MIDKKMFKILSVIAVVFAVVLISAFYLIGNKLSAPVQRSIGHPPKDLNAENVTFISADEKHIKGWLIRSRHSIGVRGD